jgi:hypothetical protein
MLFNDKVFLDVIEKMMKFRPLNKFIYFPS